MAISDTNRENFLNWAMREYLVFWGSVCLTNSSAEFDPHNTPARFSGGESFDRQIIDFARRKGFISKKTNTLTAKGWKAAIAHMKKG